ncbi:drug/metabolite exporter YedA [Streptomyces sp. NPDC101118]|uniref:drug/metabolite exporter YedA n=1 Tax=Streptomyces sp. NPDC101118 TaxID=3366109 RepID=UPI0038048ACF
MTAIDTPQTKTGLAPLAIVAVIITYIVWGSTYLAIDYTLATMPPYVMTGTRFLLAGLLLLPFLYLRKHSLPTLKQWVNCAVIGALMQGGCVASIAVAQKSITSGLAAVGIATVPIWTALMAGLYTKKWPNRFEIVGISCGFLGVILINLEGGISGATKGAVIISIAALCWSLGSVMSQHVDIPEGPMAYAAEMLAGGTLVTLVGLIGGERITETPDSGAVWSWLYLIVGGSLLAYTAYMYLLKTVRTAIATSYTLVTPVIAVFLGYWLLSEDITPVTAAAVVAVLCGVAFIFKGRSVQSE